MVLLSFWSKNSWGWMRYAPKWGSVGAAEGCDLLILIFDRFEIAQSQKIAAFGSSYERGVL